MRYLLCHLCEACVGVLQQPWRGRARLLLLLAPLVRLLPFLPLPLLPVVALTLLLVMKMMMVLVMLLMMAAPLPLPLLLDLFRARAERLPLFLACRAAGARPLAAATPFGGARRRSAAGGACCGLKLPDGPAPPGEEAPAGRVLVRLRPAALPARAAVGAGLLSGRALRLPGMGELLVVLLLQRWLCGRCHVPKAHAAHRVVDSPVFKPAAHQGRRICALRAPSPS
jgi:hypothetical protein